MKSKIKLIIFDVYGVLFNGGYSDTSKALAEKFGGDWREIYNVLYGDFNLAAMRAISQGEAWKRSIKTLKFPITVEELKRLHYGLVSASMPVFDLVRKLKKDHKVLLLSKNTREQFSDMVKSVPIVGEAFGRNIINTWEYKLPKASKETMEMVFKKFKVRAGEVVYIDDQESNLTEARDMGVNVVLYKNFEQFKKDFGEFCSV